MVVERNRKGKIVDQWQKKPSNISRNILYSVLLSCYIADKQTNNVAVDLLSFTPNLQTDVTLFLKKSAAFSHQAPFTGGNVVSSTVMVKSLLKGCEQLTAELH